MKFDIRIDDRRALRGIPTRRLLGPRVQALLARLELSGDTRGL